MKISNGKKQLAEIIHENGGWCDGAEFAAQDRDGKVCYYSSKPSIGKCCEAWGLAGCLIACKYRGKALPNWHQTVLSRDEYFYLYQEQGLEAAFDGPMPEAKPTIEQLAADYRNLKDFSDRKQQEADTAKAYAKAKLAELVAAGEALGLTLSVTGAESEPELVITNWRDLQVDDLIWYGGDNELSSGEYHVMGIEAPDYEGYRPVLVNGNNGDHWIDIRAGWGFIRRP